MKPQIELISSIKAEVSSKNAVLFNCYISGSHLYGWNSKDSDIDVRGCYAIKPYELFGLHQPKDVLELNIAGYDAVLFELKKMIALAIKGNCNILEEINAPQIYKNADFVKLQQLINNAFGKRGIYNSYRGLADFNYKKFILQGKNTVKKYLYVLRGLMAGIYVLRTGQIEPNIEKLNKTFKIPEVNKLLEIKRNGLEKEPLKEIDEGILDEIIIRLYKEIDEAYLRSKIPEEPDKEDIKKIEEHLIKIRTRMLQND